MINCVLSFSCYAKIRNIATVRFQNAAVRVPTRDKRFNHLTLKVAGSLLLPRIIKATAKGRALLSFFLSFYIATQLGNSLTISV